MSGAPGRRSALRDSTLFLGAQLAARALNFAYFVLLARTLPIDEFGALNYALSILILLDIVIDLGLSRHAMREMSREPATTGMFLRRLLPLKLAVATLMFLAVAVAVEASGQPPVFRAITLVSALCLFFTAPAMLLENVLHAHHRFALVSLAHVALSVVQVTVGGAILLLGGSTVMISLTFALTYLVYAAIMGWGVRGLRPDLSRRADPGALLRSLPAALPYLVSAVVMMFAIRAEFVILGWFGSKSDLAVFGMATKIVEASLLLPMTFATIMAPRFSRAHGLDRAALTRLYLSGVEVMLLVAFPAALVAAALVPLAEALLGSGEFAEVGGLLRVLFLGYPAACLFLYNTSALFGAIDQTRPLIVLATLGALQVAINVSLQSRFGMDGAATGFVTFMWVAAAGSTACILWLYAAPRRIHAALLAPLGAALIVALIVTLVALAGLARAAPGSAPGSIPGPAPAPLVLAAILFVLAAWGLRRILPAHVTNLSLETDPVRSAS